MRKEVRLSDIAKRLGVSTVTVSNALAGQKGVSDELRERIRETASEMGYQPRNSAAGGNGVPSSSSVQRPIHVGVIIGEQYLGDYPSFYWKLYQEVSKIGREKNCILLYELLSHEMVQGQIMPLFLQEHTVQALIVIGDTERKYLRTLYSQGDVPLVFLDFMKRGMSVSSVMTANYYGMYQMVDYLIAQGHRKIAYVGTILATNSITDRYFGYCKALMEEGIPVRKEWVIDDRSMDGQIGYIRLPDPMPTAFACNCDLTASEVIRVLQAEGYRVPQDISVVGFDNYLYDAMCDVPITTFEVDTSKLAEEALNEVIARVRGGKQTEGEIRMVPGHIVLKESVRNITKKEPMQE